MKNSMKKILCTVLVVVMYLTSVPFVGLVLKAGATEFSVGDIIEFGSYPQTQVTDSSLISTLNSISATWRSYGYMSGSGTGWCDGSAKVSDYMKYKDVTYNNERYRAVEFSTYRPGLVTYKSAETCFNYQASNGYAINNVYWFKFEPIQWRILDPSKGLVLCNSIIDSQAFNNNLYATGNTSTWWADYWKDSARTIYANNYAKSDIKEWLNYDFYYTAFTEANRKIISTQTDGKICLLTRSDTTNNAYGFINDESRKAYGTDYAKAQGLLVSEGSSIWMTQSAASSLGINISCVYFDGHTFDRESNDYGHTSMTFHGVRPAMCVDLDAVTASNIYNMGEETYSFENFWDFDASGHCFGMSVTSSGYYLGRLKRVNADKPLYEVVNAGPVRNNICHYQGIQGSIRNSAYIAGGIDIDSDWENIINVVDNHNYDNNGSLVIVYKKEGEGVHAVNFLRYEKVNGQDRIYAYDSNFPEDETYFYKDENGDVQQAVHSTFSGEIDLYMAIMSVPSYFLFVQSEENVKKYQMLSVYYSGSSVEIEDAKTYQMACETLGTEYFVAEISEETTKVKIIPLVDNATFTYMGEEYSFGKIDEDTYAEFTLSISAEDEPEFEIVNEPHEHSYEEMKTESTCTEAGSIIYTCYCGDTHTETIEPTGHSFDGSKCTNCDYDKADECGCNCHKGGISGFFFKIILFFQKIFKTNKTCSCGVAHY